MIEIILTLGGNYRTEPGKWVAECTGIDDRYGIGDSPSEALTALGKIIEETEEC